MVVSAYQIEVGAECEFAERTANHLWGGFLTGKWRLKVKLILKSFSLCHTGNISFINFHYLPFLLKSLLTYITITFKILKADIIHNSLNIQFNFLLSMSLHRKVRQTANNFAQLHQESVLKTVNCR